MPYHNISATLSAADMSAIKTAIGIIQSKLPFLINLTEEERQGIQKMGDKSLAFVSKVAEYADSHPQFRPPYMNYNEFLKDFKLVGEVNTLLQLLRPLCDALTHTEMALGAECMEYSNEFYSTVGNGSRGNAPFSTEIHGDLKQRYPRTGGGRPADLPPAV